jgi:hypothetical protein
MHMTGKKKGSRESCGGAHRVGVGHKQLDCSATEDRRLAQLRKGDDLRE